MICNLAILTMIPILNYYTLYFFEDLERNYICFLASYSLGSVPIPYGSVGNDSQFIVEYEYTKILMRKFILACDLYF